MMACGSTRNMEIVNSFMQRVHGFAALVSCSLQEASLASCNMVNAFEWACYAHVLTEGVEESGSEDHNVMQSKMREMGRGMGLPCPLDLQFLRMGMNHVIETMVLNPTLTEDMLLEMVQKVNNYSTRVRISTPLRKLKEAREVRKYCQSTEVLVQALESQLKNKYAAMPFPKYEHDLCNHLHMLLENLALWMQASHGSVWFKYRLEGVIASISQCPHGWSVLVSFFNTNLGQVERSMRPVVSQTLELIHGWMARQYGVKQTSCGVWTVSPQLMAQAAENHKVFREWYLKILEEFGDRMQADADMSELPFESESVPSTLLFDFELCSLSGMNCPGRVNTNTSNSQNASMSFMGNGSNQSEYRQLSKAVTELLCRDSQTKGLVFNLLNSKHEGRVLSVWAKLKREMVDRFSS